MRSVRTWSVVIAVAGGLSLAGLATAQMGQGGMPMHQHGGATSRPMGENEMQEHRQQMMQHMEKMQQERKQMDQRLADKVAAMHQAQGQAKIDAMAAVIDELVQQRQTMDNQRTEMMQRMMEHMRGHDDMMMGMHRGMMDGNKEESQEKH